MQIGHTGKTRIAEVILAAVLLVFAARTALPMASAVYGIYAVKLVFAALFAAPAIALLLAHKLVQRKHALLAVFITYAYSGILTVALDWTRFGIAAAVLGLGALAGYLYYLTREEITWIQQHSSPSSLPDPASPDTSSSG